ncbi:MAG: hypothetical protein DRR16_01960 [Candidatus Parabeggiatoa sp. nov. 3]|nr:MAG: hypothetical protein DRR00_11810 [Gammaproteobacteria bacterium]RKZ89735.1 MAG: hypothetical protein DRR16_01960 [Gammaproteobacteria bacterium]HEW97359.1 hypothetical protein [Beggiatoa sp.]
MRVKAVSKIPIQETLVVIVIENAASQVSTTKPALPFPEEYEQRITGLEKELQSTSSLSD